MQGMVMINQNAIKEFGIHVADEMLSKPKGQKPRQTRRMKAANLCRSSKVASPNRHCRH